MITVFYASRRYYNNLRVRDECQIQFNIYDYTVQCLFGLKITNFGAAVSIVFLKRVLCFCTIVYSSSRVWFVCTRDYEVRDTVGKQSFRKFFVLLSIFLFGRFVSYQTTTLLCNEKKVK